MAVFIISSTFRLILTERMPVLGTFMSQGCPRQGIGRLLLLEGLFYGILGGAAGCGLGVLVAKLLADAANPLKEYGIEADLQLNPAYFAAGCGAAVLILLQAYIPARYEHSDDDDSRFVAEEVSAVVHDTMYREDPITADYMYWDTGEVRKDLTSPWAMFVAMHAKEGNMAPAALSHAYLPFFLILICYALYLLIGQVLFGGDWEKTFLFGIVLSVLHLAGYTSTHTLASMLLLRIWQGKAVCASFALPLFFYLFYQIMKKEAWKRWIPLLYVAGVGTCMLSGIGIVTASVLLAVYGVLDFCYYRNWRKTLAIWLAAVPCVIFLGYYLM